MNHPQRKKRFAPSALAAAVFAGVVGVVLLCSRSTLSAGDWPMWRYDAGRTAASPDELPAELHLQWTKKLPPLEPAWEDRVNQDRMSFDRLYEPIVSGRTLLVGSSRNDRLTAYDTRTGRQKWCYYADGPIRLPAAAGGGLVYFVSDDGYLYCLGIEDGGLRWRFRGGPSDRRIVGNRRMISTWPARGGPVLAGGRVYFAAGIWPFMGTFVYALDAQSGVPAWTNDTVGVRYMDHPHRGSTSFGGLAPQGALALSGEKLLVPGGRSVPACFDRQTGKLAYYHLAGSSPHTIPGSVDRKREGGSHVVAIGPYYLNHRGINTSLYDLDSGEMIIMWRGTYYPVLTDSAVYLSGDAVVAYDLAHLRIESTEITKKNKTTGEEKTAVVRSWKLDELWRCEVDATAGLIRAGRRLYAGGAGSVSAIQLHPDAPPAVAWSRPIEGSAARLVAGDDRLFVVTPEGRLYAFGAGASGPATATEATGRPPATHEPDDADTARRARSMLDAAAVDRGYCLAFGLGDGDLLGAIAQAGKFRVIGVDKDGAKVDQLRRRFDRQGIYGSRVALHAGRLADFQAPPYVAALTVCEDLATAGFEQSGGAAFVERLFRSMRPYGGVAYLRTTGPAQRDALLAAIADRRLPGAAVETRGEFVVLRRQGPLPGAADWTHQYGNIANTSKSDDRLVKAPLGVLWFGGSSNDDVLPRHGHGPPEQVVGGRLFLEGINCLSARDVYTGEVLWKQTFPDLGTFGVYYDGTFNPDPLDTTYNQVHIAGANARGTNYVATEGEVYLVRGAKCLVLDSASGQTRATFTLPKQTRRESPPGDDAEKPEGADQPGDVEKPHDADQPRHADQPHDTEQADDAKQADSAEQADDAEPSWGYLGVYRDLLIAGADFVKFSQLYNITGDDWTNSDTTSSRRLVVMDRQTGEVLWTRRSEHAFRHNAIVAGSGKLFCIDRLPDSVAESLRRRGRPVESPPVLYALDIRTGETLWSTSENVFGTFLAYSAEHDLLLESGRASRDMLRDAPTRRMIVFRAGDGSVLWDKPILHSGPPMIHGETIYLNAASTEGSAVSLLTGEPLMREHPLTGRPIPWRYQRAYGCNSAVAGQYLLTFRSGGAGYYDLAGQCGTGNFGGFKSGCSSNLIAADGLLNAPDYTRTCTCPYPNQTSLALIHMPGVETWTFDKLAADEGGPAPIRRIGINLGAPGDRRAPNGTLWLDWPSVGGPSPDVPVEVAGSPQYFHRHSSHVAAGPLAWVAASGVVGAHSIRLPLVPAEAAGPDQPPAEGPPRKYTVRLVFLEPDRKAPAGGRRFDVVLQGRTVLEDFDIAAEAGGPWRVLVKEFPGVAVSDDLAIALTPRTERPAILCGIEAVAEKQEEK